MLLIRRTWQVIKTLQTLHHCQAENTREIILAHCILMIKCVKGGVCVTGSSGGPRYRLIRATRPLASKLLLVALSYRNYKHIQFFPLLQPIGPFYDRPIICGKEFLQERFIKRDASNPYFPPPGDASSDCVNAFNKGTTASPYLGSRDTVSL